MIMSKEDNNGKDANKDLALLTDEELAAVAGGVRHAFAFDTFQGPCGTGKT
jgi:hypothetical protein